MLLLQQIHGYFKFSHFFSVFLFLQYVDLNFQGGTIKLLVDLLNINKAEDEQKALLEELTDSVIGVKQLHIDGQSMGVEH